MPGGNGRHDADLLRVVEGSMDSVPKGVRQVYDRAELVNEIFLVMKSRGVRAPKKIQIRMAAIDIHRRYTHHPRTWNHRHHRKQHPRVESRPEIKEGVTADTASTRAEIAEALRDIRRRFGTDGLAVFLMTRIMNLDTRSVTAVMDFEPNSALAKSLTSIGGQG